MSPPPPIWLVTMMNRLIPPPSREAVLGDLWEGYRSPAQFLKQGLAVLPFLVFSQVRRRSSWPILGLQTFILFACLRGFLPTEAMPAPWMRASLPTLFVFLALAWHDTYRAREGQPAPCPAWGEIAAVTVGVGVSQLVTAVIVATTGLPTAWLLTQSELLFAASALPVLCLLRWGTTSAKLSQTGGHAELVGDYERFRSNVRWRNRLEIGAMTATLLISGTILFRIDGPVSPFVWLTLAGFALLLIYLIRNGGAPAPGPGASEHALRRLFCKELVRQHKLRSLLVWWWLTPLLIGLATHFILATSAGILLTRQITGFLLIVALVVFIHGFNAERRATVQRQVRVLESAAAPSGARLD